MCSPTKNKLRFCLIFIVGLCVAGGMVSIQQVIAATNDEAVVSIPDYIPADANAAVLIPVHFTANGNQIANLNFSVDYDEA